MAVEEVAPPDEGVWRVGRAPDPLATRKPLPPSFLDQPQLGNRFDSPTGGYRMLYFSTDLAGCFGETLARFRPDPGLKKVIGDEWSHEGFMNIGDIPADWRQRRIAVHVRFPAEGRFSQGVRFLDVESLATREALREHLGSTLAFYGFDDLDVATVRGGDRRITRWIGQWAYDQQTEDGNFRFAGIRYLSRLNTDWECWAVFDDVPLEELNRRPILLTEPDFQKVAKAYKLTPH